MWSDVGTVKVIGLRSVVRSIVENASSPTLLMSDVMRSVRDVVGRDMVVGAAFAVPATVDAPLIPVTSRVMIAKTEIFFRSIIVFSEHRLRIEIYGMFKPAIFSNLDNIENSIFRTTTFSTLDISRPWQKPISRRKDCRKKLAWIRMNSSRRL